MGFCEDIMTGPVVCTYFAVVLILVLLIAMHILKFGWYTERFDSQRADNASWQAGNPQRVEAPIGTGQIHTSMAHPYGSSVGKGILSDTSQEPYSAGYIARDDPLMAAMNGN